MTGFENAVQEARALMDHGSLVLEYRLAAARAPLLFRHYNFFALPLPTRARDVARHAAGGDLDRVWAARDDEQQYRNRDRAKAWRARSRAQEYAT